jgi:hypothetical protein
MAQKPMLRVEEYVRALRASRNVKKAEVWFMLAVEEGTSKIEIESKNYTHENTGAGHNFRVPMTSLRPYLNSNILAES